MYRIFTVLSALLALAIGAQFFLAASGAFDTAANDEAFAPHRSLGYAILLFAVLMTIVGAVARVPGRLIGMTGLVAALVLVQSLIRALADGLADTGGSAGQIVFGLHAINGLVIMGIAGNIAGQARLLRKRAGRPVDGGDDAEAPESAQPTP